MLFRSVTISFGQSESSFPGYATRPGGIAPRDLSVAFAVNTLTVVGAQLLVLRWLAGRRRTTGTALAAAAWAVAWALVIAAGRLGGGALATVTFTAAMAVFGVGESLLSPTLPTIINDLAPPGAAGRYNGLGTLAFTTGFLVGPASGAAALGAGWGAGLFAVLIGACVLAGAGAIGLGRILPAGANQVTPPPEATAPRPVPPPVPVPAPVPAADAAAGSGGA